MNIKNPPGDTADLRGDFYISLYSVDRVRNLKLPISYEPRKEAYQRLQVRSNQQIITR